MHFAAYAGALCIAGVAAFPAIDRWQNLGLLADTIHYETRDRSLALLDPDETTIAMLDYRLMTPPRCCKPAATVMQRM